MQGTARRSTLAGVLAIALLGQSGMWSTILVGRATPVSPVAAVSPDGEPGAERPSPPAEGHIEVGVPALGTAQRGGSYRLVTPAGATTPAAAPEKSWCTRVAAGPSASGTVPVAMSAAHATVREFSVTSRFGIADAALTKAMAGDEALDASGIGAALGTYAGMLDDVCALPATREPLGPARIDMVGNVAIVTPGSGHGAVPSRTQVAVIDLRNLPAVDELDHVLARTLAPMIRTPVPRPARLRRGHDGPVDEAFSSPNVYSTFVDLSEQPPLAASGPRDLPLVLLTGDRMAPAAARFAGALRMAGRAHVLGSDVLSGVAETVWRPVTDHGLAIRTAVADHILQRRSQVLRDQRVQQDDPSNPATASFRHDVAIDDPETQVLDASVDVPSGSTLGLYLMHDADADGRFSFPSELAAFSGGSGTQAKVRLQGHALPRGRYQVWVHGQDVSPADGSRFALTIDVASGHLWPDVIPADQPLTGSDAGSIAVQAQKLAQSAAAAVRGPAIRGFPDAFDPFRDVHPVNTARPELRAALLTAHGMTRLFHPYFDVAGDDVDARLEETLTSTNAWDGRDREAAVDILRRFGEVLHDGHQGVVDYGPPAPGGFLPAFFEEIGGRPVVRRSAAPGLRPGDTILAMDGRNIRDVYAEQYRLTSAATPGHRFAKAGSFLSRLRDPVTLTVAGPNGAKRSMTVAPQPADVYEKVVAPGVSDRPSGSLDDLGAPDLYYVNMNELTSPEPADVADAIAEATRLNAHGLVLDMRGYPGGNHYEVAQRLIRERFRSPKFTVRPYEGPDSSSDATSQLTFDPLPAPAWDGPIALLTGPHAVSAAENFMQMLVGAHRPSIVVGQRSAGTNGNVTAVQLPGGFAFGYTGMQVRNPDGTRFHGIGIEPDVEVRLTAADLRDETDRDLLTAIRALD